MTLTLLDRLAGADASRLRDAVRAALGEPDATLAAWEATSLKEGDGGASAGSRLYALAGTARVGRAERAWHLVLKLLMPTAGNDDPASMYYWRREALLYSSHVLDDLSRGLRAPRCYGADEMDDGSVWLWLEHIREEGERAWPIARWALAARQFGQLNGAHAAGEVTRGGTSRTSSASQRSLPHAPWLGGRRLRTWVERHAEHVERIAAAPHDPDLRRFWPQDIVDAILRLWNERAAFCDALERLPHTFCHGDAIRRNLLSRRAADGSDETVAIDWEFAGQMAIGEEVGQTLSVGSAFFDLDPDELPALDQALFTGYLTGLGEAGRRDDERDVRFAYCAHAALRNLFNAVGARRVNDEHRPAILRNYGHSWEELAERRAAIRPFLLERADEARGLIAAL